MRIDSYTNPVSSVPGKTPSAPLPGDTIEAEVLAKQDDTLLLKTRDGRVLTARGGENMEVSPGQLLRFQVSGQVGDQLFVTLRRDALPLSELLRRLDLPVTADNLRLASALTEAGAPPTAQSMRQMSSALAVHKTLTPEQAAFLVQQKIPLTRENITAFQDLLQGKNQLGEKLLQLLQMLDAPPVKGQEAAPVSTPQTAPAAGEGESLSAVGQTRADAPVTMPKPAAILPSEMPQTAPAEAPAVKTPPEAVRPEVSGAPSLPEKAPPAAPRDDVTIPLAAHGADTPETAETPVAQTPKPAEAPAVQKETTAPAAAAPPGSEQEVAPLKEKLTALFRQLTGEGEPLARRLDVPRQTRELSEALQLLQKQPLDAPARETVGSAVRELSGQMRLYEQLAPFAAVVQWPVEAGGQKHTAELYVFDDAARRQKKIDPQNATLFLSLGTGYMGRVEAFVKVVGKNIECEFRSEAVDTAAALEQNAESLHEALSEEGFRLTKLTGIQKEESANLLSVRAERDVRKSRYSFDRKV